jgi:hypothetical protein
VARRYQMKQLKITYESGHDAWTLVHEDYDIETDSDIDQWEADLHREFAELGDSKAYILIDASGFSVGPSVSEHYGRIASSFHDRHALGMIRYGMETGSHTHDTVHGHHTSRGVDPNIVPDRAAALERLEELRGS